MRLAKIGTRLVSIVGAVSVAGMVLSSGCTESGTGTVSVKRGNTTYGGSVTIGNGGGGGTTPPKTFFAADTMLDITGTNYAVGASGNATLTVLDANNNTLGTGTFGWTQSAPNTMVLTDPTSVDNYIAGFPTAVNYTMEVSAAPPPADGTAHTAAVAFKYQGTTVASASATFAATCPPPNVNSPVRCHL
jgi:hypothetical protein